MHLCLDREQLSNFIRFKFCKQALDTNMELFVANSEIWEDEISIINYLFSIFLESISDNESRKFELIQDIYNLKEEMFITIQEFDFNFIKSMILFDVNNDLSFEEKLIEFQNKLRNYEFNN